LSGTRERNGEALADGRTLGEAGSAVPHPQGHPATLGHPGPARGRLWNDHLVALALVLSCTLFLATLQMILPLLIGHSLRPYTILYVGVVASTVFRSTMAAGVTALAAAFVGTLLLLAVPSGRFSPEWSARVVSPNNLVELMSLILVGVVVIRAVERHRLQRDLLRDALNREESLRIGQERMMADVLRSATQGKLILHSEAGALPAVGEELARVELKRPEHLAHLRAAVRGVAETAGLSTEQTGGFLTAAHETAMNAVVHGGGGEARIGTLAGEPLTLVVLIRDNGPGIALDKIPERTLHGGVSGANSLGMGFSMVLDGVDRVHLRTTPSGTQILLEARREPLPPAWLDRPLLSVVSAGGDAAGGGTAAARTA
jgi:serine/threonine-protein kinase RsbT